MERYSGLWHREQGYGTIRECEFAVKEYARTGVTRISSSKYISPGDILSIMETYRCTKCGYVYAPISGDYTQKIPPNTPFEALPKTWVCPRCGAEQKAFVRSE